MKRHYPFGIPNSSEDVVWRCEAKRYSYVIDPDAELYGTTPPQLELTWAHVTKRTPKGAWVAGHGFARLTAKRCRWRNTIDEAVESFIKRKERHIAILTAQLKYAQQELALTQPRGEHGLAPLEKLPVPRARAGL